MYVSYLSMGFLDIGIKKHQGSIGKRIFDCSQRSTEIALTIALLLTDWPLTTCSWARISRQHLRLAWRAARILMIKFWTLLHETFTWIYRKYANTNKNSSICRIFVVFSRKSSVSRFTQKPFGSKNVVKPTLDMKQQVFPRNKLRKKSKQTKKQFTQWINGWNS